MKAKTLKIIVIGFLFVILYYYCLEYVIIKIQSYNNIDIMKGSSENVGTPQRMKVSILEWCLYLPYWALCEEIKFRFMPMMIWIIILMIFSLKFSINKLYVRILTIIIGVLTSIWFGYVHGNYVNILFQGMAGFVFFLVWYLTYRIEKSFIKATLASTLTHLMCNLYSAIYLLYLNFV